VVHTVEEALQGTACSLILSCVLEIKTVLKEESIVFTELKYSAVFTVKHLIHTANAVGADFVSSASKQRLVLPITLGQ